MKSHNGKERGAMGVAIVAASGVFLALYLALPDITLWPSFLICLTVVTMIVGHFGKNYRSSRSVARSSEANG
jgi:hypothetical protein